MPEEILLLPNQRLDVEDARYGMKTFPVNAIKDVIHRCVSGDYRGGFVLEGFRVEINTTTPSLREVIIYNGIAIDRDGQLITLEAGDDFASNDNLRKSIRLPNVNQNNHLMIEFDLVDSKKDSRVFIDPTFQNTPVTDSGGDTSPAPRGKEFTIDVPTRQAKSWRIVNNQSAAFSDTTDPSTGNRTLRIPIAIIPVNASAIDTASLYLEDRYTTIIRQPAAGDDYIECADTRHFPTDTFTFDIQDYDDPSDGARRLAGATSTVNNLDNNSIGFNNAGSDLANVRVGDRIRDRSSGANLLAEGSAFDCRPMLFALTDWISDQEEFGSSPTALDEYNFRNNKYYLGRSLLNRGDIGTAALTPTSYPNTTGVWNRDVKWQTGGLRSEHKIKTLEDQLIVLGTLLREMKYGEQSDRLPDGDTSSTTTSAGTTSTLIDSTQYFEKSMEGGSLEITSGPSAGSYGIVSVEGLHQITFTPIAPSAITAGVTYTVTYRNLDSTTGYVNNRQVGYLNEVYRGRIDRRFNTYTADIQERFRANKTPLVTVGDGVTTYGDYIGDSGLAQAFADVANSEVGGIIYVKSGSYTITSAAPMRSGMKIVGDGVGETTITFDVPILGGLSTGEDFISDIGFMDISLVASTTTIAGSVGRGNIFTVVNPVHKFTMDNCYVAGGSVSSTTDLVTEWAFNFSSNATNVTSHLGLDFSNTRFLVSGGGVNFEGARNVNVHDCLFQSETDSVVFTGMVEGIRFINNNNISTATYGGADELVPGQVRINNCMFEGQMTPDNNAPYRGWIYVASSYTGQIIKVSNCDFIGDIFGNSTTPALDVRSRKKNGRCITANSAVGIEVSNCNIHSYIYGISTNAGMVNVSGGKVFHTTFGLLVSNSDAWVALGSGHQLLDYPNILNCEGTNFLSYYGEGVAEYNSDIGIFIGAASANNTDLSKNKVFVRGCSFIGLSYGISGSALSSYANITSPNTVFNSISVLGCEFSRIGDSAFGTNSSNAFSNDSSVASTTASWAVESITYSGNAHYDFQSGATNGAVQLSANHLTINDNVFHGAFNSALSQIINVNGVGRSLNISNNSFNECYNTGGITMMSIEIARSRSEIKINSNQISNAFTAANAIQNGVYFTYYRNDSTLSGLPNMLPSLEMVGNNFSQYNGNFAVCAQQDENAANSEIWEWISANVSNNTFYNNVASNAGFSQYSNNANYDPGSGAQDFLGGSTAPGYIGMLDLRRFNSGDTGDASFLKSQAVITNNLITLEGAGVYSTTSDQDLNANIGIRISKWPFNTDIHNNSLRGCQALVKWTYETPRENTDVWIGGYTINMTGNNIFTQNDGCAVDINPATGFGENGDSGANETENNYVILNLHNNIVKSDSSALNGAYTAFYGVTRLWHLNNGIHSDEINTSYLKFIWNVTGNILINSVFYIDSDPAGANADDYETVAANLFGSMRFDHNNKLGVSTATQSVDIFGVSAATGTDYVGNAGTLTPFTKHGLVVTDNMVLDGQNQSSSVGRSSR